MNTQRTFRKVLLLVLSLALALGAWVVRPTPQVRAAISSLTIDYYPAYIHLGEADVCNSGTPFAVRVTVFGNVGDNFAVKIRLGTGACTWSPISNQWLTDSGAFTSMPRGTIGSNGEATLWLYGSAKSSATSSLTVRARTCNSDWSSCPTPNVDSPPVTVNFLNMSSTGGWLEESNGTARAGRAVVVKNGTTIVGMYVAEDNGVTEGYSGAGYYKVAVPVCSNCGYTVETWALNNPNVPVDKVNTMGTGGCPNNVGAGSVTSLNSCTVPTSVTLASARARTAVWPLAAALIVGSVALGMAWRRRKS